MSQSLEANILLVDDDEAVREVTAAILEDLGYSVIEAQDGPSALEALERGARVDLLMVDFSMPGMNGGELTRKVQERRPGMPVLLVTGYADARAVEAVGEERIVLKPFRNEDLARKIRTALGAGENGQVVTLRR
jgi:CheY-like chemotaxis protein